MSSRFYDFAASHHGLADFCLFLLIEKYLNRTENEQKLNKQ